MNTIEPSVKRKPKPSKRPPKSGTPIRNGLLLILFLGFLVFAVVLVPLTPDHTLPQLYVPGTENEEGGLPWSSALRISEVMSSNGMSYPDENGNYSDWVEIVNISDIPINLEGVGLSDRENQAAFIFPDMELPAGDYLVIFCDKTRQSELDKPLHARFKISALGQTIYLSAPTGQVFDSVKVPAMHRDTSYAMQGNAWVVTSHPTPGHPNTMEAYTQVRENTSREARGLIINEIMASNSVTLADEDGDYPDWIELYNRGVHTIDLSNYAISDNEERPIKWRFPKGAVIQPGAYYLVFASGKNRPGGDGLIPHTSFKLAAEGETVIITDIYRQTVDKVAYENLATDTSWGHVSINSNAFQVFRSPTPGLPNTQ